MTITGLKNFKSERVLLCETHNFFEAPFPIKQPGYSGKLMYTMSRNRSQALKIKGTFYLRIPMQII